MSFQENNSYQSIQEEGDVSEEITSEITDTENEDLMEESQQTETCKNNQTFTLAIKIIQVSIFFKIFLMVFQTLLDTFWDFCNAVPEIYYYIWMELSRLKL